MAQFRNSTQNLKRSASFGSEQAERPHSVGRELNDLREDVENAFSKLESHTSVPVILCSDLQFEATNNEIKANCTIQGVNFLAGQLQASVTLNNLTFSSTYPGTAGNDINVTVVKAAGDNADMDVSVANNKDITITLGTGAAAALAPAKNTNTLIAAEFNTACLNVARAAIVGGNGGASDLAVTAKTLLAGGTGDGATLRAHEVGQSAVTMTISTFTDTAITVLADTCTLNDGLAVTDVVGVVLESNRAKSNPFHAITVA